MSKATAQKLYSTYQALDNTVNKMDNAIKLAREQRSHAAKALLQDSGKGPYLVKGQPAYVYNRGETFFLSAPRGRKIGSGVFAAVTEQPAPPPVQPAAAEPIELVPTEAAAPVQPPTTPGPVTEGLMILAQYLTKGKPMTAKANTILVPASPPGRMTEAHFTRLATLGWTYAPSAKCWKSST